MPVRATHILSANVSQRTGRWCVSLQVIEEVIIPSNTGPVVGVDLGIRHIATLSEGSVIENPEALSRHERKLKRLQRSASRKKLGSRNRAKANHKVARLHRKISNIRKNTMHKSTTMLARTKSVIGMEDLWVVGMMANHYLAKALQDGGLGEFRRQMEYKTAWYGSRLVEADR